MLKSDAKTILNTVERRLKPSRSPWHGDPVVLEDWADLIVAYNEEQVRAAFSQHLEAGSGRWPNYYTFRDILRSVRSKQHHPSNTSNCNACSGTGWVPDGERTIRGHNYSVCIPCPCPAGQHTERTELYTKHALQLCVPCNGNGWLTQTADKPERCTACNGGGITRGQT